MEDKTGYSEIEKANRKERLTRLVVNWAIALFCATIAFWSTKQNGAPAWVPDLAFIIVFFLTKLDIRKEWDED